MLFLEKMFTSYLIVHTLPFLLNNIVCISYGARCLSSNIPAKKDVLVTSIVIKMSYSIAAE